jgi:hypothetical protein
MLRWQPSEVRAPGAPVADVGRKIQKGPSRENRRSTRSAGVFVAGQPARQLATLAAYDAIDG